MRARRVGISILVLSLFTSAAATSLGFGGGRFGGGFGGARFGGGGGGFDFHNDAAFARPQDFSRSSNWSWAGNRMNGGRSAAYNGHITNNDAWNHNYRNTYVNNGYVYHGATINNPVYGHYGAWGWNGGSAWYPAPYYWGGGFWGAWAIGATSAAVGAAVYGSIAENNVTYTSYQVQPSSPGAKLLESYQLTQTPCGPPNLVIIYGPSNSVICAHSNNFVAAGRYSVNSSTLTLTSG